MKNSIVKKGAKINYAIIADDAIIEEGAEVGGMPESTTNPDSWGIAVVGQGAVVKSGQKVLPGEMIEGNNVFKGEGK